MKLCHIHRSGLILLRRVESQIYHSAATICVCLQSLTLGQLAPEKAA